MVFAIIGAFIFRAGLQNVQHLALMTTLMIQNMSAGRTREANSERAGAAANHAFAMLLCARIFVLKQFVR
jgi:hypothetical protein